jgi:hypothetical protein
LRGYGAEALSFSTQSIANEESTAIHEHAHLRPSWAQVREFWSKEKPKSSCFARHDGGQIAGSRMAEDRRIVSAG